jgi:hypothetical protein
VAKKESDSWQFLVDAAKRAVEEQGYSLKRVPGRGLSNIWKLERDGKTQSASIRTTRDRWIAFPPLDGGSRWKTLDDVDLVAVAAVDSKDKPKNIEVYLLPAAEVRERFAAAYEARRKAKQVIRDDFGMWVGLDKDTRDLPASVGSGIIEQHPPIAVYGISDLIAGSSKQANHAHPAPSSTVDQIVSPDLPRANTIAEVMAWARQRVSEIAGVRLEAVKLDLKIEY